MATHKTIKKCVVCGREFEGYSNSKFCSKKCRNTKVPVKKHIGEQHFELKIVDEYRIASNLYAICECSCGKKCKVRYDCLINGNTKSCGHIADDNKFKRKIYAGMKNNNGVEIIKELDNYKIQCKCPHCGKEFITSRKKVYEVISCGCKSVNTALKNIKEATEKYCIDGTDVRALTAKMPVTNKSGIKGVSWNKNRKKWVAQITFKGKNYNLGRYDKKEEAAEARKEAENNLFGNFLEWYNNEKEDKE